MTKNGRFTIIIKPKRIFFPKGLGDTMNEPGYAIFIAKVVDKLGSGVKFSDVKIKGESTSLSPKETYKVTLELAESNERWGDTYEIKFMKNTQSVSTPDDVRKMLIGVIGETKGNAIMDTLEDPITVLEEEDVQALCKVKGVGVKNAKTIINKYNDCKDYGKVYGELAPFGVTPKAIKKIISALKNEEKILKMLKENPYELSKYVEGFGFKKCDAIAQKVGVPLSSPLRIRAGIVHILKEQGNEGKEYILYQQLLKDLFDLIGLVDQDNLVNACRSLVDDGTIILTDNGLNVSIKMYYEMAKKTATHLNRIGTSKDNVVLDRLQDVDVDNMIEEYEKDSFKLAERQRDAVMGLLSGKKIQVITGSAGSGKSTVSKLMLDVLEKADLRVSCCAFTGKASKRISEATGRNATTIHRLLGVDPSTMGFVHNEECPLPVDVVLLDEGGMVSADLFLSLVKAIPTESSLIILGDIKQLTAIGSGNILGDLLDCNNEIINKVELNKIQRQKGGSEILDMIDGILEQTLTFKSDYLGVMNFGTKGDAVLDIFTDTGSFVLDWIAKEFSKQLNNYNGDIMQVQCLGATRVKGELSVYAINRRVKEEYNPFRHDEPYFTSFIDKEHSYPIQKGDKVVCTKNSYQVITVDEVTTDIYNGSVGIVDSIDGRNITIDFDGELVVLDTQTEANLELAYCLTTNKFQGSESKCIIGAVDNSSYVLATNEFIYTLVSRGKQKVRLFAQNYIMRQAIRTKEQKTKRCLLVRFLKGELELQ